MSVHETARANMIESQLRPNRVTDERVIEAFLRLRRELFVPAHLRGVAYVDEDLPLGRGRYLMEPMVVARLLIVAGGAARSTGLATTVAMALVPVIAAIQGQPGAFVAMSLAIFAILMIRRLEGVGTVIRHGVRPGHAILYRCVFDSSGPPPPARRWRTEEEAPPR